MKYNLIFVFPACSRERDVEKLILQNLWPVGVGRHDVLLDRLDSSFTPYVESERA